MLSSGSNICDGSMLSPVLALRLGAFFLGDFSTFAVVCRREVFLGLRFGAGVNSSSSGALKLSSSSDSSTMTFFRAARRVGRVGEIAAMLAIVGYCRGLTTSQSLTRSPRKHMSSFGKAQKLAPFSLMVVAHLQLVGNGIGSFSKFSGPPIPRYA